VTRLSRATGCAGPSGLTAPPRPKPVNVSRSAAPRLRTSAPEDENANRKFCAGFRAFKPFTQYARSARPSADATGPWAATGKLDRPPPPELWGETDADVQVRKPRSTTRTANSAAVAQTATRLTSMSTETRVCPTGREYYGSKPPQRADPAAASRISTSPPAANSALTSRLRVT
jgi:hypothetical protein